MEDRILKIEEDLKETIKAMEVVREQIRVYNKKGEELAAHATFLSGKLEALRELKGDENV